MRWNILILKVSFPKVNMDMDNSKSVDREKERQFPIVGNFEL